MLQWKVKGFKIKEFKVYSKVKQVNIFVHLSLLLAGKSLNPISVIHRDHEEEHVAYL